MDRSHHHVGSTNIEKTYAIGSTDGLRNSGLGQDEVEPVEIGLVRVRGRVLVGYEGRRATGTIIDIGRRERDSFGVLNIQISLSGKATSVSWLRR